MAMTWDVKGVEIYYVCSVSHPRFVTITHDHSGPRTGGTPIYPSPVPDLSLANVGPHSLGDESGKNVEECDDPFGSARRHEIQGGRENDDVQDIVEQSKAEE